MTHSSNTEQEVTEAQQREAFEMFAWVNTTFEQAMKTPYRRFVINEHARRRAKGRIYLSEKAIDKLIADLDAKNHKAHQPDIPPNT